MSAADGAVLDIRVVPRAGRTTLGGRREGAWVVRVAAAPVDGAANDALLEYLARLLRVPRRDVVLASGERSRTKRVRVATLSHDEAAARLSAVCPN